MSTIVRIKKLHPDAIEPSFGHPGDAGADLYAIAEYILKPSTYTQVKTGIALEFPAGYVALIWDKTSSPVRGWHTMGGVFDSGYRGEYILFLYNITGKFVKIKKGDKIAQVLIQPIVHPTYNETHTMTETSRGTGREGSTGMR